MVKTSTSSKSHSHCYQKPSPNLPPAHSDGWKGEFSHTKQNNLNNRIRDPRLLQRSYENSRQTDRYEDDHCQREKDPPPRLTRTMTNNTTFRTNNTTPSPSKEQKKKGDTPDHTVDSTRTMKRITRGPRQQKAETIDRSSEPLAILVRRFSRSSHPLVGLLRPP